MFIVFNGVPIRIENKNKCNYVTICGSFFNYRGCLWAFYTSRKSQIGTSNWPFSYQFNPNLNKIRSRMGAVFSKKSFSTYCNSSYFGTSLPTLKFYLNIFFIRYDILGRNIILWFIVGKLAMKFGIWLSNSLIIFSENWSDIRVEKVRVTV